MHKSNEDELTKTIENFIKKSMMIILNSRIPSSLTDKMHLNSQDKWNSKFLTKEKEIIELEEIFSDEYEALQSFNKNEKSYTLDIYFRRKEAKILIEKWTFRYNLKKTNNKSIELLIYKKLSTLIRSIYSITRILPGFTFLGRIGFNFSLDFKIYTRMTNQENFMTQTRSLKFDNLINICGFEVKAEYLLKQDIFKLENEFKKIEKDNKIFIRPRFLSEDNFNSNRKLKIPSFEILNFEDTSINDDYFSKITEINNSNLSENTQNERGKVRHTHRERRATYHSNSDDESTSSVSKNKTRMNFYQNKEKNFLNKNYLEHSSILDSLSSTSQPRTELEKFDKANDRKTDKLDGLMNFISTYSSQNPLMESMNLLKSFKRLEKNYYKDLKTSDTSSEQSSSSESFELDIEYMENNENCEINLNILDNDNDLKLDSHASIYELKNNIHHDFLLEDVIKKFDKMKKKAKTNPPISYSNFFRLYYRDTTVKDMLKKISGND